MKKLILVIDDDQVFNRLLVEQIGDMGLDAVGALSWAEASSVLSEREPDLIFLDFRLPDADTPQLVEMLAGQFPVIVLTGYGSIRNAVSLIQAGAVEYLTKPVGLDELEITIRRELENAELRQRNAFYQRQLASRRPGPLIGNSRVMDELLRMIEAVAPTDATVLVQGESGTGKEMVAQAIHQGSLRHTQEMVTIDGGTLQETLFESELFGYERGAFTGADRQKKGLIEEAASSTLFLDEIGETTPANQAKLLRVLETGTFRRVGSTELRQADIRIISATHRPLAEMLAAGTFRQDLFYRLNVFPIFLPPLRERGDDVQVIADALLPQVANGRKLHLADEARQWLRQHDFPGNVRELRNLLERACLLSDGDEINLRHLPANSLPGMPATWLRSTAEMCKKPVLTDANLQEIAETFPGNRKALARHLGISERTLYRRLGKPGSTPGQHSDP